MQDVKELLKEAVEDLRRSVESNEIVGKPVINGDGTIVLPISKISIGFVAGGTGADVDKKSKAPVGVSGGGVSITPVGFLFCGSQKRFVRVDGEDQNKWTELFKSIVNVVKRDE